MGKKKHSHTKGNGEARNHQDAGPIPGQYSAEDVYSQFGKIPVAASQQTVSNNVRSEFESGLSSTMLKAFL